MRDEEKTLKELLLERHKVIQTLTLALNMRDVTTAQIADKRLNELTELIRAKGEELNERDNGEE